MNILVTGGAGFIGSSVAKAYIERGHKVTIVDNLSTGKLSRIPAEAKFLEIDITDPRIEDLFLRSAFHIVNHQAAHVSVRESLQDPLPDAHTNILGTLNLLHLCSKYRVSKFILAATGGAMYGDAEKVPTDENQPIKPISPYGIAKATAEEYLFFFGQVHGLSYVSLRYSNVYGPHADSHGEAGVITIFADKLVRGEIPTIFGDGTQTRDFVYVDDIVRANVLALDYPENDFFNISTCTETSVNELYEIMRRETSITQSARYEPAKPGEIQRSALSHDKAALMLGWRPEIPLTDGLQRVMAHFKQQALAGR